VVEPGRRSIETAREISKLAQDIGITNLAVVGNKVHNDAEKSYITSHLSGYEVLGFIPFDQALVEADLANRSVLDASPSVAKEIKDIYQALLRPKLETLNPKIG